MKYSAFKWCAEHFNGTDWDQKAQKNDIFKLIDDPATCSDPALRLGDAHTSDISDQRPGRTSHLSSSLSRPFRRKSMVPVRPGKNWADDVTTEELGNYDYLMFSNIYYKHPDVRKEILRWGRWMVTDVGIPNFRLDAAQHISRNFTRDWIATVQTKSQEKYGKDATIIGEVWCPQVSRQIHWLDAVTPPGSSAVLAYTFDTPLLNRFSCISGDFLAGSRNADLRTLLSGPGHPDGRALVSLRPAQAVTCVSNHDTQAGQSSFTPIDSSLKALFYAFILLRQDGLPCVFWGDLVGIQGPHAEGPACKIPISSPMGTMSYEESGLQPPMTNSTLPSLMLARRYFAYGPQRDYFDSMSCIGWTRAGTADFPGCVVILSIALHGTWTYKKMAAGCAGERWVDVLQKEEDRAIVVIGRDGVGVFPCLGGSVGVFVKENEEVLGRFPADLGFDI
jgi:alpha-amylase